MIPALVLGLVLVLVLSRGRLSNIMDTLKVTKPAPPFRDTTALVYDHWREVRAACLLTPQDTTAAAVARCWRAAGLTQLFQSAGYCWRALAAISIHETGYGTSHAALEHDNLWGVSYDTLPGPGVVMVPYAYVSMAHAAEHLLKVLSADRYTAARVVKNDGYAFILALGVAGYNGSREWREGVLRAYAQIVLQ